MQTVSSLKRNKGIKLTPTNIFIISVIAVLYCPFFNMMLIGNGFIGDTMIQVRTGLDMIAKRGFIVDEIYSWHKGLSWCPHEEGWYFLVGAAYKLFGIAGVIGLAAVFNYTMAAVIFKENLKTSNPYMIIAACATARCFSFPNYNARPHLISQLIFIVFVFNMLKDSVSTKKKCILYIVFSFLMGWFHGGLLPVFLVVFLVFIAIEFVYKNFKTGLTYLGAAVVGFGVACLNPAGIGGWTFGLKQNGADDIWRYNEEWLPKTFSTLEITVLLLILVAFAADKRVRDFEKKTITKLCFYCMFIIISCKYCRFMNYTAIVIAMFGAEEINILLLWLNEHITKFDLKKLKLGDISHYIISVFCVGFMLFTTIFSWTTFFPTNSFSDISAIAAYDENVITILKEKNYQRIYNSFNSGTWLAFYGIPVHIDNRIDPYMEEYSGVDHIRGKMLIADIDEMDAFVDEYDADALVLDLNPGTTDEYFIEDLYESDRYNVIYDNTAVSSYDQEQSYRWLVVEVVR